MTNTDSAQVFTTKADAQAKIAKMRGWNAKPVKVERYPDADGIVGAVEGVWLIKCDGFKFLRVNGFVN